MKKVMLIIAVAAVLTLSGCATLELTDKEKAAILDSIGTRVLSGK